MNSDLLLSKIPSAIDVTQFLDYREYLEQVYQWLKQRKQRYSYVLFCQELGLGHSNMIHLCIRGKRHLRFASLKKISSALQLKGIAKQYLECLHRFNRVKSGEERERLMQRLVELKDKSLTSLVDKCQLEYYAQWYHPVVRELITCQDFDGSAEWISHHILPKITIEQARNSLELLQKLGYIRLDPQTRRYVQCESALVLSDNIESLSVMRYHQKVIDIAKESLTTMDADQRDIRSFTMSVSETALEEIRQAVFDFQNKIVAIAMDDDKPQTVLQLNLQMFPFIKPSEST